MSDITACPGHHCPDRGRCLRAAEWNIRGVWQSWSSFDRDRQATGECRHLIPLIEPEVTRNLSLMPKIKVSGPSHPRGQLAVLLASIMAAGVPIGDALDAIGAP